MALKVTANKTFSRHINYPITVPNINKSPTGNDDGEGASSDVPSRVQCPVFYVMLALEEFTAHGS